MKRFPNIFIWYLKNYIWSAIFTTVIFFISLQLYIMAVPNSDLTIETIFSLTIIVFIISIGSAVYFGFRSSTAMKKTLRSILVFLSSLRRGKYSERMVPREVEEISAIANELNEVAFIMEEQVAAMQRLANEKMELHQQVHAAAVLEERQRLARDLHDSVSQQLFALSMMSSATLKFLEQKPETAKDNLEQIAKISAKAQGEMRALLLHLRPIDLSGEPLSDGVISLLKELKAKTNLSFEASIDDIEGIDRSVEEHLFRIIQEALSNILRHSGADKIEMTLTERGSHIYLYISDNGKGFNTDEEKKVSYGLKTMRERCEEIGGIFTLRSLKGKGTYIEVRVPMNKSAVNY